MECNRTEEMSDLSDEEFEGVAQIISQLFPELLLTRDEEGVINDFYEFYKRKRRTPM